MLTVLCRTIILYLLSILAIRLMGKRQVGQLQPYEFVLALMIAELAAAPMEEIGAPLLYGVLPILGLMIIHGLATLLSVHFTFFRRLLSGGPSVIIRKGVIQYDEMRRMCYTTTDLMEELRAQGIMNIADVCTAILETNGRLSAFLHGEHRPLAPSDIGLSVPYEGMPMTLIVDGRIQQEHLQKCGLNEQWLLKQLRPMGFSGAQDILLASLDTQGRLFIQGKREGDQMHLIQVLDEKAVHW